MKKRYSSMGLFLMCLFITLSTSACGIKYMVKGRVVDGVTGKPVEGAAVAVHWYYYKFGPPYASGYTKIETAGAVSDSDGYFKVPKYSLRHSEMGVYKKGYVCWYSERIFPKNFDGGEYPERKGFSVGNGMKIKLEPFTDEYSKFWHARFANNVAGYCWVEGQGPFYEAIRNERELLNRLEWEKNRRK